MGRGWALFDGRPKPPLDGLPWYEVRLAGYAGPPAPMPGLAGLEGRPDEGAGRPDDGPPAERCGGLTGRDGDEAVGSKSLDVGRRKPVPEGRLGVTGTDWLKPLGVAWLAALGGADRYPPDTRWRNPTPGRGWAGFSRRGAGASRSIDAA